MTLTTFFFSLQEVITKWSIVVLCYFALSFFRGFGITYIVGPTLRLFIFGQRKIFTQLVFFYFSLWLKNFQRVCILKITYPRKCSIDFLGFEEIILYPAIFFSILLNFVAEEFPVFFKDSIKLFWNYFVYYEIGA